MCTDWDFPQGISSCQLAMQPPGRCHYHCHCVPEVAESGQSSREDRRGRLMATWTGRVSRTVCTRGMDGERDKDGENGRLMDGSVVERDEASALHVLSQ